jgi:protein phosphatase
MSNYSLHVACLTDSGKVRAHNEDSVSQRAESGVLVLADGMGGYNAGEVASALATELVAEGLHRERIGLPEGREPSASVASAWISAQVRAANRAILQRAEQDASCAGMGATLVLALFHGRSVSIGHVGDSRVYRYRRGQLEALTRDHSLLEEQIRSGMLTREQARDSHNRNVVTRALGVEADVATEIGVFDVRPGDLYLLCSDGLTDMLDDETVARTLAEVQHDLPLAASNLVQLANDCGGRDNISVILARIGGAEHWWSRLYGRLRRAA